MNKPFFLGYINRTPCMIVIEKTPGADLCGRRRIPLSVRDLNGHEDKHLQSLYASRSPQDDAVIQDRAAIELDKIETIRINGKL